MWLKKSNKIDDDDGDGDEDKEEEEEEEDKEEEEVSGDRMAVGSKNAEGSRSRVKANISRSILLRSDSPVLPSLGSADCITTATVAAVTLFAAGRTTHPRVSDARSDGRHSSRLHH
jgi:hypothetical protein